MKKIVLIISLILLPFSAFSLELIGKSYTEIKGVQVFVLSNEYLDNYDTFFADLKKRGVNTVFFRVFHNKGDRTHMFIENKCEEGGVYFNSDTACVVADLLPHIIESAHNYDIQVYAWMATRSLSFLKNDKNMSYSFSPEGGIIKGYGANIFQPFVRKTIVSLFKELAMTNIDGILIQDDFIMKYSEGADNLACNIFKKETGINCTEDNFFKGKKEYNGKLIFDNRTKEYAEWSKWKAIKMQSFLYEIRSATRVINPKLKWAANVYYETPVYPERGLSWYAQSIENLWQAGIDYIAVMVYQDQIASEMGFNDIQLHEFTTKLAKSSINATPDKINNRAVFKVQIKLFDLGNSTINYSDINNLCNTLTISGGTSFVQLPISNAKDVKTGTCGYRSEF